MSCSTRSTKQYENGFVAVDRPRPGHRRRRVPRARRTVRVRQVDRPADGRRTRADHRRRAAHRRPAGQREAEPRPRHRHGVPELRPVPAHERRRQHLLRAQAAQDAQGGDQAPRRRRRQDARARGADGPPAEDAVGRPAPARRDGPGDRAQPAGVPDGRAAVQPRRQAARADACRHRRAAARARRDDHLRHPRPGRGDDDGRPRRRDAQGPAATGRRPAGAVRRAGQPVRRRLHRLAADEHGRGDASSRDGDGLAVESATSAWRSTRRSRSIGRRCATTSARAWPSASARRTSASRARATTCRRTSGSARTPC